MKPKNFCIVCLFAFFLSISSVVFAELSVTSKWRIEEAAHYCDREDNAFIYTDYWRDSVTDKNQETVCLAEQFAKQVAMDGDEWLEKKAVELIKQCREKSNRNEHKHYLCIKRQLTQVTKKLSSPCKELGAEGLWDEKRCRRLVSFIFLQKFDKIMEINSPLLRKMMDVNLLKFLFHPIAAIIFLILFVLDILFLIDPGNWARISRLGFVIGSIILVSCFLKNEFRFLGSGIAIIILIAVIIWNHVRLILNPEEKKRRR